MTTDINALVERLRGWARPDVREAAEALTAQQQEIERLRQNADRRQIVEDAGASVREKALRDALRACRSAVAALSRELDETVTKALAGTAGNGWRPIEDAPRDVEIDIWVSGPGSRRVPDCRWGTPTRANWGDRFGCDQNLPEQWITRDGFALDRRNGVATHFRPLPTPPAQEDGSC